MNFSDAIAAHMDWVVKFQAAIEQAGSVLLDVEAIASDNECTLGKWLYSELDGYSECASFIQLKSSHANFHLQASKISRLINDHHPDAAQIMLSSTGEFFRASRDVIMSIELFRRALADAEIAERSQ